MPTKKPYSVSVRLKQHDKPTRRVPAADTETGEIAATIVSSTREAMPGDVHVKMSTFDGEALCDTPLSIAMWLALGVHIVENTNDDTQRIVMQAALNYAAKVLSAPEEIVALHRLVNGLGSVFDTLGTAASIVEEAKKTSTEGKN